MGVGNKPPKLHRLVNSLEVCIGAGMRPPLSIIFCDDWPLSCMTGPRAKQSSKVKFLALFKADGRYDPYSGGLGVHHAYGSLIS